MLVRRSINIDGVTTSISLEATFWLEVDRRSEMDGLSWQEYVRALVAAADSTDNRSSVIRSTVLGYLQQETNLYKRPRFECWWEVRGADDVREIGTRGVRLFAGRQSTCDLCVDGSDVSRKHVMLAYDGDQWRIVDLESNNGLWVEDKRVPVAAIGAGDVFKIGGFEIKCLSLHDH